MKRFFSNCVGLSLLGIGAMALLDAKRSAAVYGLPTEDAVALAYLRGCGARDLVIGLALLTQRDRTRSLLTFTSLIAIADATLVTTTSDDLPLQSLAIHGGGAVALLLGALFS